MRPTHALLSALFGALLSLSSLSHASDWQVEYDGFGTVKTFASGLLSLSPKESTQKYETHAALALFKPSLNTPISDFTVTFEFKIQKQLRQPANEINPWETIWLFFNYVKNSSDLKTTNYLLVKENGLEIGKAWNEVDQSFIYTSDTPRILNKDRWQKLKVIRHGLVLRIQLNDGPVRTIPLTQSQRLFLEPGAVGLYTEDARVLIRNFSLNSL